MASAKSSKKRFLLTLAVIAVLFVLLVAVGRFAGWIGGDSQGHPVEVSTVSERTITRIVTATGRIQPEIEIKIAPDVSGEIIELNVREGDFVYEGDILVRIRPDIIQARLDESNATLLGQQARMEQNRASKLRAKNEYEQKRVLFDRNMVSQLEYENARRAYEAEQASFNASTFQVENARAQLRRIEEELRQTTIRAPMTGTVSRLDVERGERVVGSIQMAGTEMLRIAQMEQMEVRVNVNENDIVYVSENDTARIDVDAYPGRQFVGIVTEIANSAITRGDGTAEQITEYPVKIRILSPHNTGSDGMQSVRSRNVEMTANRSDEGTSSRNMEGGAAQRNHEGSAHQIAERTTPQNSEVSLLEPAAWFKPGMTATVDIETIRETNVISVPLQAVTMRDFNLVNPDTTAIGREDMRRVVFRVVDDHAAMTEVHTGISDDRFIHILSGVEKGDEIVSGNYRILSRVLSDGDAITITSRQ